MRFGSSRMATWNGSTARRKARRSIRPNRARARSSAAGSILWRSCPSNGCCRVDPMNDGLRQLVQLAALQPLTPTCDHFYFLRHGQTDCNARRLFQAPDEPLSALGLQQAARAAELLAGEPIRSIVSSNVNRALTTAHTVSTPHGMAPVVFDGLRERNFGALIGTSS